MSQLFHRYAAEPTAQTVETGPTAPQPAESKSVLPDPNATGATGIEDRRADMRVMTVCRLVKIITSRCEGLARCRNISNGGVNLEMHMPANLHDRVTVGFSPSVEIDGQFVWIDGCDSGVSFDAPIDCISVLRETSLSNPGARAPRLKTALPASLAYEGGQCGSLINDISLQGMCVTHDGALYPGLNVRVMTADGRERRAMVCWTRDGLAGLQLLDRFRLEELPPLLAMDRTAPTYY